MGGAAPAFDNSLGNTGTPTGFQPFSMNNVLDWLSNYFPQSAGGVPNNVTLNQPTPASSPISNQPAPFHGLPDKAIALPDKAIANPLNSGPLAAPPPINTAPQDQVSQVTNVLPAPQAAPNQWGGNPTSTGLSWVNALTNRVS